MAECVTAFFDIDGTLGWTDPVAREQMSDTERKLSPVPSPIVADAIRRTNGSGQPRVPSLGALAARHPSRGGRARALLGMACLARCLRVKVGDVVLRDVALPPEVLARVDEVLAETGMGALLESVRGSVDVRGGTALERIGLPQRALRRRLSAFRVDVRTRSCCPRPRQSLWSAGLPERWASRSWSSSSSSEVGLVENSKSGAVKAILDYLGDAGTTYGFGDSENDLSLFEQVDVPVAMGNASPVVKAAASMVTDTVDNDGVATALATLGLI